MRDNQSKTDRIIRVIIGIVLIAGASILGDVQGVVLFVLGVVVLITGTTGFCPLYRAFGIDTCEPPKAEGS